MGLSNIISSFTHDKTGIYDPGTQSFKQLDPNKISQQMKLVETGKERGKANLPPSGTSVPDDIEQKISSLVKSHEREAIEICNENNKVLLSRLKNLNTQPKLNELATIADKAQADFDLQVHQTGFALYNLRLKVTKTEEELADFKKEHKLDRSATYKKSPLKFYAVLSLILLFETALNAYFFSKQNEFGYLGGASIAIILSVINIAIGLFVGNFGYRFLHHAKVSMKAVGALIITLCLASLFSFNLGVAHYRDAITNAPSQENVEIMINQEDNSLNPKKVALEHLKQAPLELGDIESYLLIIVGMIISLFASYKAYRSDDPYFRYGEVARRREDAIHEYGDMATDMLDDLEGLRNERLEQLDETQRLITFARGESGAIKSSFVNWNNILKNYIEHLEETARILIAEYRYSNMSARTEEAPNFFKKEWKIERLPLEDFSSQFDSEMKIIEDSIEKSQDQYTKSAAQIRDAYEFSRKTYQRIEDLQPSQVKPEEFQKWLTDAETKSPKNTLAAVA